MPFSEIVTELGGGPMAIALFALGFLVWFLLKHVFKLQDLRIEDSKERLDDHKQHANQLVEITGVVREAVSALRSRNDV